MGTVQPNTLNYLVFKTSHQTSRLSNLLSVIPLCGSRWPDLEFVIARRRLIIYEVNVRVAEVKDSAPLDRRLRRSTILRTKRHHSDFYMIRTCASVRIVWIYSMSASTQSQPACATLSVIITMFASKIMSELVYSRTWPSSF